VENWRRKSVTGLSSDYLVYSILGYAAYTAYTAALYFSPGVQAAYMAAHAGEARQHYELSVIAAACPVGLQAAASAPCLT